MQWAFDAVAVDIAIGETGVLVGANFIRCKHLVTNPEKRDTTLTDFDGQGNILLDRHQFRADMKCAIPLRRR